MYTSQYLKFTRGGERKITSTPRFLMLNFNILLNGTSY